MMRKIFLFLVLILVMVSFTGCGSEEEILTKTEREARRVSDSYLFEFVQVDDDLYELVLKDRNFAGDSIF